MSGVLINSSIKGGKHNDLSYCKTAGFQYVTGNNYSENMYFHFDGNFVLDLSNFFANTHSLSNLNSVEIDTNRNITNTTNMFFNAATVKKIILNFSSVNITGFYRSFYFCRQLKEIDHQFDFSSIFNSNSVFQTFASCTNLEEIRFVQETLTVSISINDSPKLSLDSLSSIILGLADMTGETAQTLSLHSTAKAKLTAEQIASATAKNWTIA